MKDENGKIKVRIRPAMLSDATGIFQVKEQIRLPAAVDGEPHGGFLLGTSREQYEYFIKHDDVLVAECIAGHQIVGFTIVLKHASVLNSTLWLRAQEVRWDNHFFAQFLEGQSFDQNVLPHTRIAYYEQLGFLDDDAVRVYAKYLAFASVHRAFETHDHIFVTTVKYPIVNRAPLSFLRIAGFECVGTHDEVYPEYGRIISDVYHLERSVFHEKIRAGRFQKFIAQVRERGYLI
jgi:hypothetical protein